MSGPSAAPALRDRLPAQDSPPFSRFLMGEAQMINHVDVAAARLRAAVVGTPNGAGPLYAAWTVGKLTVTGLRDLLLDAWAYSDPSPEMVIRWSRKRSSSRASVSRSSMSEGLG